MDLYKFATQNKLRFPSNHGGLSVENLFDLPLKAADGFDLNTVAQSVNAELKREGEEDFVNLNTDNKRRKTLEIALEILKDVIKTKQDEIAKRVNELERVQQRRKILDAINSKKDAQLSEATIDDLEKQLAALDS